MTAPTCHPTLLRWRIPDSRRPLSESIREAMTYFENKYGRVNTVRVGGNGHGPLPAVDGVTVTADPLVLDKELELGWVADGGAA